MFRKVIYNNFMYTICLVCNLQQYYNELVSTTSSIYFYKVIFTVFYCVIICVTSLLITHV